MSESQCMTDDIPKIAALSTSDLELIVQQLTEARTSLLPFAKECEAAEGRRISYRGPFLAGIICSLFVLAVLAKVGMGITMTDKWATLSLLVSFALTLPLSFWAGYTLGFYVFRVPSRIAALDRLRDECSDRFLEEIIKFERGANDGFLWKYATVATLRSQAHTAGSRERLLDDLAQWRDAGEIKDPMDYGSRLRQLLEIASEEFGRLRRIEVVKDADRAHASMVRMSVWQE